MWAVTSMAHDLRLRSSDLVQTVQEGGYHQASWKGRDDKGRRVGSGMYLYRLRGGRSSRRGGCWCSSRTYDEIAGSILQTADQVVATISASSLHFVHSIRFPHCASIRRQSCRSARSPVALPFE